MHISNRDVSGLGNRIAVLLFLLFSTMPLKAAELLYFYDPDCGNCKAFEQEVGRLYDKTPESRIAPLKRQQFSPDMDTPEGLAAPIPGVPSFVLMNQQREVARLIGYSSDTLFWMALTQMLSQLPPSATIP